jgi:hypothetical protein
MDTFAFIIHPIDPKRDVSRKYPFLGRVLGFSANRHGTAEVGEATNSQVPARRRQVQVRRKRAF